MRKRLKAYANQTKTFCGTVARLGKDSSSPNGYQTLLLKRIKTDGRCVADHLWFDLDPFWKLHVCAGDMVEFEATVTPYAKGYLVDGNELIADLVQELDYGLDNLTDTRLVACAYPRGGKNGSR